MYKPDAMGNHSNLEAREQLNQVPASGGDICRKHQIYNFQSSYNTAKISGELEIITMSSVHFLAVNFSEVLHCRLMNQK